MTAVWRSPDIEAIYASGRLWPVPAVGRTLSFLCPSATRPQGEHRSGVGAKRRPPQYEPAPQTTFPGAPPRTIGQPQPPRPCAQRHRPPAPHRASAARRSAPPARSHRQTHRPARRRRCRPPRRLRHTRAGACATTGSGRRTRHGCAPLRLRAGAPRARRRCAARARCRRSTRGWRSSPRAPVSTMRCFRASCARTSRATRKRLPITTPSAPSASAAAIWRPLPMPPPSTSGKPICSSAKAPLTKADSGLAPGWPPSSQPTSAMASTPSRCAFCAWRTLGHLCMSSAPPRWMASMIGLGRIAGAFEVAHALFQRGLDPGRHLRVGTRPARQRQVDAEGLAIRQRAATPQVGPKVIQRHRRTGR